MYPSKLYFMNEFPLAIRFVSDENQAYFVEEINNPSKNKKRIGNYMFVVSHTKEGVVYPLELDHINRLISYELIEVIQ